LHFTIAALQPRRAKFTITFVPQDFDASEFVDSDLEAARKGPVHSLPSAAAMLSDSNRAPTRAEVDGKVSQMQHKLSELKRAQQELERERAGLEETRRRQVEFATGRQEIVQSLTRGIALLEEAEFGARRDAEQMNKTLAELREALTKVQSVKDETWSRDNFNVELTRGLTAIENARLEWNTARQRYPLLDGAPTAPEKPAAQPDAGQRLFSPQNYLEVCKLGLAFTWPIALVGLAVVMVLLLRKWL
jgi:hypothetical protein